MRIETRKQEKDKQKLEGKLKRDAKKKGLDS